MNLILANPLLVVLLGVVILTVCGVNCTRLGLRLLQSLHLVPKTPLPPSEQIFRKYAQRAWEALQRAQTADADAMLQAAVQESAAALKTEQAIAPATGNETAKQWMTSPLLAVLLVLLAFLLFGGIDGCERQFEMLPRIQADVVPTVWQGEPGVLFVDDGSHYDDVLRAYQRQQQTIRVVEPADVAPALPHDFVEREQDLVKPADTAGEATACPCVTSASPKIVYRSGYRARARFWSRGPVRRGLAAVVRRLFSRRR